MQSNALKIILGLLIALFAWLIYQNLEQYEQRVDYGWSEAAKRNPFLAAHQFLEGRINSVDSISHLNTDMLDDEKSTLLIPNANYVRLPSQQDTIMEWVKAGGHLVIGIGDDEKPAMLSDLGFSRDWTTYDYDDFEDEEISEEGTGEYSEKDREEKVEEKNKKEKKEKEEEKSFADLLREENERILKQRNRQNGQSVDGEAPQETICSSLFYPCDPHTEPPASDTHIVELYFESEPAPLAINFPHRTIIQHEAFYDYPENADVIANPQGIEPFYWEGDERGIHFVQTDYGDGMISILSDFDIWRNQSIGHFDHAFFLDVLVNRSADALLLYGKYMPSLDVLLYQNFFEALIAFFILLGLSLLYFSRRFGPMYNLPAQARRSRSEQFTAHAQFFWQQRDSASLLQHLRSDIQKRASRRWHDFADWNPQKQTARLAELSELPITSVDKVMHHDLRFQESEFTHTIRALQILRNSL